MNKIAFFIRMLGLLAFAACGKQGPRETPLQRAERLVHVTSEYYRQELAVVSSEKDEKIIKKQLGKIVDNKKVKRYTSDTFNRIFLGKSYNPETTPFHRYVSVISDDIAKLKDNEVWLAHGSNTALLERSKDIRCMLFEIKQYVLKHKEHKAEARYRALRNEMVAQRR